MGRKGLPATGRHVPEPCGEGREELLLPRVFVRMLE